MKPMISPRRTRRIAGLLSLAVIAAGLGPACSTVTPTSPATDAVASASADRSDAEGTATNILHAGLAAGIVRVEYTLRYDKGERPAIGDTYYKSYTRMQTRPNYRNYMSMAVDSRVEMERPYETPGYLLTPTRVLTQDTVVHPRFIAGISVVWNGQRIGARISGFVKDREALLLELEKPLRGTRPLAFAAETSSPSSIVSADRVNGVWTLQASPYAPVAGLRESGAPLFQFPFQGLVVDKIGRPLGFVFLTTASSSDAWKGSPSLWPVLDAKAEEQLRHRTEIAAQAGIVKVQLNFRSPKPSGRSYMAGGSESQTERYASGLLIGPDTVLALVDLKRDDTARIERILVLRDGEEPVAGEFVCSLHDYTALVVKPATPLKGCLRLAATPPDDLLHRLLVSVDLRLQGDDEVIYTLRQRVNGFQEGWRSLLHPSVVNLQGNFFIFNEEGRLVAFPMDRRRKPGEMDSSSWQTDPLVLASQMGSIIENPLANADPDNVPVPEKEEKRLAWMGVQSQPLGPELARFNKVAHLTSDGSSGALISYVYPDSPASKAGVKPGWILLRLHVDGYPRPIELRDFDRRSGFVFPWSQIDNVPVEAFENAPTPWESMNSVLNTLLTDVGFGKKYKAEFFADGQVIRKDFETAECPRHYDRAARMQTGTELGLTLRDMTFEVRQYFHRTEEDPGVVISKVEPGSKAAIAGIKYFEVVTHVNDTPVFCVSDFANAIHEQEELKLAVKRMTTGRVVRIRVK